MGTIDFSGIIHIKRRQTSKKRIANANAVAHCVGPKSALDNIHEISGLYVDTKQLLFLNSSFTFTLTGFVDTLPISREMLPSRRSYSQSDLVDDLLKKPYTAHNSLADSRALKQLIEHLNPSNEMVAKHSFSIQEVASVMATRIAKQKNVETLEPLVVSDIVTKYMADKMAASGVDYKTLERAYQKDRRDGIKSVLKGAGDEQKNASVTKQCKVIDSLAEYFGNILEMD